MLKDVDKNIADLTRRPDETKMPEAEQKELERLMDLIIADNVEALKELSR